MWRTNPWCCSSAKAVSGASIEPSAGPYTSNMARRLTTSSTSRPRLRRLSCTARLSASADLAVDAAVASVGVIYLFEDWLTARCATR